MTLAYAPGHEPPMPPDPLTVARRRIARIVAQLQQTSAALTSKTAAEPLVSRAIGDAEDAARVIETAHISVARAEVES